MSSFRQQLETYISLLSSELEEIATESCIITLYSDFIYKNIQSESTEYVHSVHSPTPILHITCISFSKRKYGKKIKDKITELIESIISSFKVKIHTSWTRGIRESDYNYLETTRIGTSIIKYINGRISIIIA